LNYVIYHPYKFENINIAIYITYFKLIVDISVQMISIYVIATYDFVEDVVMVFNCLIFISEIDN
jgi:hypothetical protein